MMQVADELSEATLHDFSINDSEEGKTWTRHIVESFLSKVGKLPHD